MNRKDLDIFYKNLKCGVLTSFEDGRYQFEYLDSYEGPSISLTLNKDQKIHESSNFFPFFDGLIPEGWLLNYAKEKFKLNILKDRFELFATLCSDCIGAVHITRNAESEKSYSLESTESSIDHFGKCLICYEECDDFYHEKCAKSFFGGKINPVLSLNEEVINDLADNSINKKLTIPGVQKKLSLDIENSDKSKRLTVTNLWGRYIFKPRGRAPHYPENEHLIMSLAKLLKIDVAESALIPLDDETLGFITKRFDRAKDGRMIHQEDFCQILEKEPFKKYSGSIEQVAKVLSKNTDAPGDSIYRLLELVVFSYIVGNVDLHLKNITLQYESKQGRRLSPAYDLLSTDLYIADDEDSALAINGKKNKLKANDFNSLCEKIGVNKKVFINLLKKFSKSQGKIEEHIDKSFLILEDQEKLKGIISSRLKFFRDHWDIS